MDDLRALLAVLMALPPGATTWGGWEIARIHGGANGRVFRVAREGAAYAVKFAVRDERDRAGREFAALTALTHAAPVLAPRPVLLAHDLDPYPAVVQTWEAGSVSPDPPANDAGWDALLDHLAATHTVTPARVPVTLPTVVLSATDAASGLASVAAQVARIPPTARPATLRALLARAEQRTWPAWPTPPRVLCHGDPNPANYLRRPDGWRGVDWENAGWGDPAFEIADLLTHPAYMAVFPDRYEWIIAAYRARCNDRDLEIRVCTYVMILHLWWVARFARAMHEQAHDTAAPRLGASWQADTAATAAKYAHYLTLAEADFPRG